MPARRSTPDHRVWVAVLRVSPAVRAKHSIDADDVSAAVICAKGLTATWNDHPARGRRALVEVWVGRSRVLAVLYPTELEDAWNLGSAYTIGQ